MCDPDRMREVIVNLLTNALKFTPADGSVVLETGTAGPGMGKLTGERHRHRHPVR